MYHNLLIRSTFGGGFHSDRIFRINIRLMLQRLTTFNFRRIGTYCLPLSEIRIPNSAMQTLVPTIAQKITSANPELQFLLPLWNETNMMIIHS